ncbi:MAG TPA: transporter [Clostridiales bacterium]|nr:transporter [Clostridiales bacterium]
MKIELKFIVKAAIIASIYTALTILLLPISYGPIQVRVSEALTVLPYFTPAAIPGLFVGCLIANIAGGLGWMDIIFGSLATLIAAFLTYLVPKSRKLLVPLPAVIVNGLIVGWVVSTVYTENTLPMAVTMLTVAGGQAISCYGLGYPLLKLFEKYKIIKREE